MFAPDDGTGIARARQGGLPDNVALGAERQGDILVVGGAGAVGTAETLPVVGASESDETEDQLALVPSHFFKDNPKPGMREMVEVVNVYENEVSIKCVYGEDKEEEAEGETPGHPAPDDSDDMMM